MNINMLEDAEPDKNPWERIASVLCCSHPKALQEPEPAPVGDVAADGAPGASQGSDAQAVEVVTVKEGKVADLKTRQSDLLVHISNAKFMEKDARNEIMMFWQTLNKERIHDEGLRQELTEIAVLNDPFNKAVSTDQLLKLTTKYEEDANRDLRFHRCLQATEQTHNNNNNETSA